MEADCGSWALVVYLFVYSSKLHERAIEYLNASTASYTHRATCAGTVQRCSAFVEVKRGYGYTQRRLNGI